MDSSRKRKLLAGAGAALFVLIGLWIASSQVCLSAWLWSDVVLDSCPDGKLRQTLSLQAESLRRGAPGAVRVGALAHYATESGSAALQAPVQKLRAALFLVDAAGQETPLPPDKEGWKAGEND